MVVDAGFDMKTEMSGLNDSEPAAEESSAEVKEPASNDAETTKGIESLDQDENFKKEVPQEFSKHPRFRKLYWEKKENERKLAEYDKRIKEFEAKANEQPEDEELDDNTLMQLAQERGYTMSKAEQKEVAKVETELNKLLATAQSPEERQWLENYTAAVKKEIMTDMNKNIGQFMGPMQEMVIEYRLDKSEKAARKLIDTINQKHGLSLDYDKDIDPELAKMVKANKNITPENADIVKLVNMYLAENGISLGKKLSEQELKKLNETKKQANIEAEGSTVGSGNEEFRGVKETLKSGLEREGLRFFS